VVRAAAVRYSFAGLRVLPLGGDPTASSRREHLVRTGCFGMVSIAGGKLTTHRRIALEALRRLPEPRLSNLRLVDEPLARAAEACDGDGIDPGVVKHLTEIYGSAALAVLRQHRHRANALERVHPEGPDIWAQVYHALVSEWAVSVEDVVRRRTTLAVRGLACPAVRADVARAIAASPA
jgi:glycerol-3-phosphate dehydrogenase